MESKRYRIITTNNGSYYVFSQTFDSLYEYVAYLKEQHSTTAFIGQESSIETDSGQISWTGTKSIDEAYNLCVNGEYDDDFDKFEHKRQDLEKNLENSMKRCKTKRDVIGYAPNVPAYLMGLPKNMYNISKTSKQPKKSIKIYYNISSLGFVSPEQMRNRGICALTLIKELEQKGYNVSLHLFAASYCNGQVIYTQWNLKDEGQALNYRSLYFPMVNPSFLRRLHFRLREVTPGLDEEWVDGYGRTCDFQFSKDIINCDKTGIVINQPDEHNIHGNDIVKDYENFRKSISKQIQDCFTPQEQGVEHEM